MGSGVLVRDRVFEEGGPRLFSAAAVLFRECVFVEGGCRFGVLGDGERGGEKYEEVDEGGRASGEGKKKLSVGIFKSGVKFIGMSGGAVYAASLSGNVVIGVGIEMGGVG
jgi:hypothetical protein